MNLHHPHLKETYHNMYARLALTVRIFAKATWFRKIRRFRGHSQLLRKEYSLEIFGKITKFAEVHFDMRKKFSAQRKPRYESTYTAFETKYENSHYAQIRSEYYLRCLVLRICHGDQLYTTSNQSDYFNLVIISTQSRFR